MPLKGVRYRFRKTPVIRLGRKAIQRIAFRNNVAKELRYFYIKTKKWGKAIRL